MTFPRLVSAQLRCLVGMTFVLFFDAAAHASLDSIGSNGINSKDLGLTGFLVNIGQVELNRPGIAGVDSMSNLNLSVGPAEVFRRDGAPDPNNDISDHAEGVAGTMISTDPTATGVATGALLYSSAFDPTGIGFNQFDTVPLTLQHIATQAFDNVRAVNLSFGASPFGAEMRDGNSHLTKFVDWSAAKHDTLYVVAGPEIAPGTPLPSDNFNGITVAASAKNAADGVYRNVATINIDEDAFGARTSIDILAPGQDILTTIPGLPNITQSGTSMAAPHVTGTVALLQEFAEIKIGAAAPKWGPNARRHEVMKAVLMNSADKLEDDGTFIAEGSLLGMEWTVLDQNGDNWLSSEAFTFVDEDPDTIPLDDQMGTGHLNAKRALQQFAPGESDLTSGTATVPTIGWDYGHTSFAGDFNRYVIDQELQGGDVISITLAWDRNVEFEIDGGTPGVYDPGDTFEDISDPNTADDVINDLDLFLVETATQTQELFSIASVGTVEHIFASVPLTGNYEIWVFQDDADIAGGQDYGLAWWYGLAPEITIPIAGDFDGDGDVDGTDFLKWQRDMSVGSLSDWENNYGMTSAVAASTAVPEPSTVLLLATGLAFWCPRSSRDRMSRKQTLL